MNRKTIYAVFFIVLAVAACSAGEEPAPWWKQVDDIQSLLLKWVGALTVVGTALIAAVGGLAVLVMSKIKDVRDRQDRQGQEKRELQSQVVDLAKQVQPQPSESTIKPPSTPL